ncbi:MAG: VOC family protein [Solirubrobacteraceae bacterium]
MRAGEDAWVEPARLAQGAEGLARGIAPTTAPQLAQIALCSSDMPASLRLYSEALGFAPAGGEIFWGHWLGVQGLGEQAASFVWWLVGRQDFVQVELFQHTSPEPRPLPADWSSCDLGWVRWGVAVPDFDAVLARLARLSVATITPPRRFADGLRRVCFRDPHVGVVTEVIEDGPQLPGGIRPRHYELEPAVLYATLSVSDLELARAFYLDTIGLVESEQELHSAEMEELWGLRGARRECVVARGGEVYLELVRYEQPAPAARPADHRLSDLGMMNVAAASRDRERVQHLYERIRDGGYGVNAELLPGAAGGTYVSDGEGNSFEIFAVPREFDELFGFVPRPIFNPIPRWPRAESAPPRAEAGADAGSR